MPVKVLPAMIASLESEAEERGQALAHGLCKVVKQFKFIATLYMMCDVLPVVFHLSKIFQYPDIDLSVLQKLKSTTVKELKLLKDHNSTQLQKLGSDLKSSLSSFNISYNAESLKMFKQQIQVKFIDALITHIQNWLPDTGKLASFSVFNPKDLPGTSEKASDDHYGEDKVAHLGELYGNGKPPLISKVGL